MLVVSKNPSLTFAKKNFRHFVQQGGSLWLKFIKIIIPISLRDVIHLQKNPLFQPKPLQDGPLAVVNGVWGP